MKAHPGPGDGWVDEQLQVGGTSVYCRRSTSADGVPLVHLHGFAISGAYLMPTARALAARGVNVVPDLPGYGRSERRERVLDIPGLADSTIAILDGLDIDKAVLVGNSMGCAVSLEVAHERPSGCTGSSWSRRLGACTTNPWAEPSGSWRGTSSVRARECFPSLCPTT